MEVETRRRRFKRIKSTYDDHEPEKPQRDPVPKLPDYNRSKTKVCHSARTSLLATESDWENFSGFVKGNQYRLFTDKIMFIVLIPLKVNLLKVIVILANTRLFIDNLYNFGWQVHLLRPIVNMITNPWSWTNLWIIVEIQVFAFMSLHIERLIAREIVSPRAGSYCHIINCSTAILAPCAQILVAPSMPVPAIFSLIFAIVFFMKLWSYAQSNRWYREEAARQSKESLYSRRGSSRRVRSVSVPSLRDIEFDESKLIYPNNLTTSNLYYFLLAPTLCYEMQYPRSTKVRIDFAMRRLLESVFLFWLSFALIQQWILPHLDQLATKKSQIILLYEVVALAVPNNVVWVVGFVMVFHSWLNFLAEVLCFADREFYRDWWNSQDTAYFWSAWNIPIHKWCVRHIYKPLLRAGYRKGFVAFCVFLFSAVFHEVIISVPLQRVRFYSAAGMLMQVPLTPITKAVTTRFGGTYGNMLVWFQIIIGQPMGVLAYVTDWYLYS